jgi:signal transduction histidine kinase
MTTHQEHVLRLRTKNRIAKAIAISSILVLLTLLLVAYRNLMGYVQQNEEIRHSHAVLNELGEVLSIVKDAESGTRGYLLSNDDSFLLPYDRATGTLADHLGSLAELVGMDGGSEQDIESLRVQVHLRMAYLRDRITDQRGRSAPPGKPDSLLLLQGKNSMDQLRRIQSRVVARYERVLRLQEAKDVQLKWTGPAMVAIYAGGALVCVSILLWWMFLSIERAQGAEQRALNTAAELDKEARTRELAERSLKRVLDSSQSGIMAFRSVRDAKGKIVDFECTRLNEAAEAIFHKKAEDMMHQSMTEIRLEDRRSPLFASYVRIVESGEPLKAETEFTREGHVSTLSISAVRLLDGLVITFTDITEAKRHATLVAEGERLSVTGRFARMVGHEVRNPLTNIQLALDQLEADGTQLPEQQIYLDILRRNSHRIGQLITEMLHTSRPLEMKMTPGAVNDVLADAFARVKDRCELRKAKCDMALDPDAGKIPIDGSTLTVAFTNLLVNAVEAMEEGKGRLEIRSERVKDRIQVTVRDNGKGMSAEDRERIFQPFFSGRTGGMGLGLTEARNIFNAHGVLLSVESELGKGTTFRMLFPV